MHKTVQIMLRLLGIVATSQAMLQPAASQTGGETTSSPSQTNKTIDYANAKPMPLPSANTKPPLDERAGPTPRERLGPAGSSPAIPETEQAAPVHSTEEVRAQIPVSGLAIRFACRNRVA